MRGAWRTFVREQSASAGKHRINGAITPRFRRVKMLSSCANRARGVRGFPNTTVAHEMPYPTFLPTQLKNLRAVRCNFRGVKMPL